MTQAQAKELIKDVNPLCAVQAVQVPFSSGPRFLQFALLDNGFAKRLQSVTGSRF